MTKKAEQVRCRYFVWKLTLRNGIWQADGRSGNTVQGLKRYSLDSATYEEAIENLQRLDALRAVELGVAAASVLNADRVPMLGLRDGCDRYLAFVRRPAVLGGASPKSAQRYHAVFEKFVDFATAEGVTSWNAVTLEVLSGYTTWLDANGYEYATEYLELTTIKQAMKWLIKKGFVPATCAIELALKKPGDTTTYCYTADEVVGMIEFCYEHGRLRWLGDIINVLSHTGMRIAELAGARWCDLSDDLKWWEIPDRSRQGTLDDRRNSRTTKGRRSRRVPIHKSIQLLLARLDVNRHLDGRILRGPQGGVLKPDVVRNILRREVLTPLSRQFPAKPGADGLIDGRLHSFRHFFCSWCAANGVPERTLMSWLGHADSNMVRRYFHLHDGESRRRMEELELISEADIAARLVGAAVVPNSVA